MDRVLVVSYHFPPSGGSKTRRLLKFLKYLPQFHWTPIVLTTKGGTGFGFDPSLLKMVPREVHVRRAFDLSALIKKVMPASQNGHSAAAVSLDDHQKGSLKKHVARFFRQAIVWTKKWSAIPDAYILMWAPFAIPAGFRAIAREETALIYSTGPPFSNHIIGMCLKRITGKPLILDFRDAWTANPVRRMKYPGIRHAIESLLEKIVIRSADLVVCTTEGITQDFRRRYEREASQKFLTLPNGYDREEFCAPAVTEKGSSGRMRIVHTGFLSLERSPKPLLIALRRLFDESPDLEQDIEVYLVGEIGSFLDGKTIENYLEEFRLESVVKLVGHVPQPEAIRYQMTADILLLVIGVVPAEEISTYGIASKVFDYMIAGRPVLTLADPGPVSELVEKTAIGSAFAPSDIAGIKRYLSKAIGEYKQGQLNVKSNLVEIEKYDFRQLTAQIVDQFHTLLR